LLISEQALLQAPQESRAQSSKVSEDNDLKNNSTRSQMFAREWHHKTADAHSLHTD